MAIGSAYSGRVGSTSSFTSRFQSSSTPSSSTSTSTSTSSGTKAGTPVGSAVGGGTLVSTGGYGTKTVAISAAPSPTYSSGGGISPGTPVGSAVGGGTLVTTAGGGTTIVPMSSTPSLIPSSTTSSYGAPKPLITAPKPAPVSSNYGPAPETLQTSSLKTALNTGAGITYTNPALAQNRAYVDQQLKYKGLSDSQLSGLSDTKKVLLLNRLGGGESGTPGFQLERTGQAVTALQAQAVQYSEGPQRERILSEIASLQAQKPFEFKYSPSSQDIRQATQRYVTVQTGIPGVTREELQPFTGNTSVPNPYRPGELIYSGEQGRQLLPGETSPTTFALRQYPGEIAGLQSIEPKPFTPPNRFGILPSAYGAEYTGPLPAGFPSTAVVSNQPSKSFSYPSPPVTLEGAGTQYASRFTGTTGLEPITDYATGTLALVGLSNPLATYKTELTPTQLAGIAIGTPQENARMTTTQKLVASIKAPGEVGKALRLADEKASKQQETLLSTINQNKAQIDTLVKSRDIENQYFINHPKESIDLTNAQQITEFNQHVKSLNNLNNQVDLQSARTSDTIDRFNKLASRSTVGEAAMKSVGTLGKVGLTLETGAQKGLEFAVGGELLGAGLEATGTVFKGLGYAARPLTTGAYDLTKAIVGTKNAVSISENIGALGRAVTSKEAGGIVAGVLGANYLSGSITEGGQRATNMGVTPLQGKIIGGVEAGIGLGAGLISLFEKTPIKETTPSKTKVSEPQLDTLKVSKSDVSKTPLPQKELYVIEGGPTVSRTFYKETPKGLVEVENPLAEKGNLFTTDSRGNMVTVEVTKVKGKPVGLRAVRGTSTQEVVGVQAEGATGGLVRGKSVVGEELKDVFAPGELKNIKPYSIKEVVEPQTVVESPRIGEPVLVREGTPVIGARTFQSIPETTGLFQGKTLAVEAQYPSRGLGIGEMELGSRISTQGRRVVRLDKTKISTFYEQGAPGVTGETGVVIKGFVRESKPKFSGTGEGPTEFTPAEYDILRNIESPGKRKITGLQRTEFIPRGYMEQPIGIPQSNLPFNEIPFDRFAQGPYKQKFLNVGINGRGIPAPEIPLGNTLSVEPGQVQTRLYERFGVGVKKEGGFKGTPVIPTIPEESGLNIPGTSRPPTPPERISPTRQQTVLEQKPSEPLTTQELKKLQQKAKIIERQQFLETSKVALERENLPESLKTEVLKEPTRRVFPSETLSLGRTGLFGLGLTALQRTPSTILQRQPTFQLQPQTFKQPQLQQQKQVQQQVQQQKQVQIQQTTFQPPPFTGFDFTPPPTPPPYTPIVPFGLNLGGGNQGQSKGPGRGSRPRTEYQASLSARALGIRTSKNIGRQLQSQKYFTGQELRPLF